MLEPTMSRPNAIGIAAVLLLLLSNDSVFARMAQLETKLNMRESPGPQSRVIAVLPAGANVSVGTCDAEWCQVSYGGRRGFASKMYLGNGAGAYAAAPPVVPQRATEYDADDGVRVWQWQDREWRDRYWREQGARPPRR